MGVDPDHLPHRHRHAREPGGRHRCGGDAFIAKSVPEAVFEAKMKAMSRIAALRAELSRANRKLAALANLDGLTGLFNRRYMDQRLDELWAVLSREGAPVAC
jgi:PleD family two-component response regulator